MNDLASKAPAETDDDLLDRIARSIAEGTEGNIQPSDIIESLAPDLVGYVDECQEIGTAKLVVLAMIIQRIHDLKTADQLVNLNRRWAADALLGLTDEVTRCMTAP